IIVAGSGKHDHAGGGCSHSRLFHVVAELRTPIGFVRTPRDRADVAAVPGCGAYRGGDVLSPIVADARGFSGRRIIGGARDLDIECYLAVRIVLWITEMLVWVVLGAVNRDVCDLGNWLVAAAEELVHVVLYPTATEFDDGDHAASGKPCRPIIRRAE